MLAKALLNLGEFGFQRLGVVKRNEGESVLLEVGQSPEVVRVVTAHLHNAEALAAMDAEADEALRRALECDPSMHSIHGLQAGRRFDAALESRWPPRRWS